MLDKLTRSARFVRLFLSADNLNRLREVCLNESGEARAPVDLGLAVIVNSDADVEAVSLTRTKPAALINGYNYITGETLFTCSEEEHAAYIETFPLERVGQLEWIRTQRGVVEAETERFVTAWLERQGDKGAEGLDFAQLAFDLTFAILSKTFLGADYDPEQQADFEAMAVHLNRYLLYQVPPVFPSFFSAKKRWFARVDKIIAERKTEMARPGSAFAGTDVLSTLIRQGVEIDDLTARSLSQAFWAGTFTHSAVIVGAIFHVGRDPAVLEYLLSDRENHAAHVAKEALRMYPGAPIYDRGIAQGKTIEIPSGRTFKHGDRPFVCPHIVGTDPQLWPDPLTFSPRRFQGHEGFQSKGFIPFGYAPEQGGRACTGRYYALEVLPWIIGTLFEKFEVKVLSDKLRMAEYAACAKTTSSMRAMIRPK